jgi:hypothetical protein
MIGSVERPEPRTGISPGQFVKPLGPNLAAARSVLEIFIQDSPCEIHYKYF